MQFLTPSGPKISVVAGVLQHLETNKPRRHHQLIREAKYIGVKHQAWLDIIREWKESGTYRKHRDITVQGKALRRYRNCSTVHIMLLPISLLLWEVHGILEMERLVSPRGPPGTQFSCKKLYAPWRFRTRNIFWKNFFCRLRIGHKSHRNYKKEAALHLRQNICFIAND